MLWGHELTDMPQELSLQTIGWRAGVSSAQTRGDRPIGKQAEGGMVRGWGCLERDGGVAKRQTPYQSATAGHVGMAEGQQNREPAQRRGRNGAGRQDARSKTPRLGDPDGVLE